MKTHCPHLSQFPRINHAFFEEDREPLEMRGPRAMHALAGKDVSLIVLNQVHSNRVFSITEPDLSVLKQGQEGDGLVTNLPDVVIGIETADCGPVLFYDSKAHIIGACHAGWRGAKAGIIQATLEAMENLGANRSSIHATLGPTIQQQNYEVGPEFPDLIGEPYDTYFYLSEKQNHHHFNLPQYIQDILLEAGVGHVYDLKVNSFTSAFASRRRTLPAGTTGNYFSGLSAIMLIGD